MKLKTPVPNCNGVRPAYPNPIKARARRAHAQRGLSLIELMIGITIGLLTVAVAMGALMVSRSISGTVSDASQLQQQAAYAFRVVGQQLRQAGSLRLNMAPLQAPGSTIAVDIADPVAFETEVMGFSPSKDTISGVDAPGVNEFKLTVGYRNYKESLYAFPNPESMQRNCLGEANSDTLIQSKFVLDSGLNRLRCAGSGAAQPFAENVANFQVRYLQQDVTSNLGNPRIRYVNAATIGADWGSVQGVEVCLVLYGIESIAMPAGSSYIDCDGTTAVDMTTLTGTRANRMHMVFRNVYQLRSQGLM